MLLTDIKSIGTAVKIEAELIKFFLFGFPNSLPFGDFIIECRLIISNFLFCINKHIRSLGAGRLYKLRSTGVCICKALLGAFIVFICFITLIFCFFYSIFSILYYECRIKCGLIDFVKVRTAYDHILIAQK